jgi:hypothetical protein
MTSFGIELYSKSNLFEIQLYLLASINVAKMELGYV